LLAISIPLRIEALKSLLKCVDTLAAARQCGSRRSGLLNTALKSV
jgi:hypothetical protein